MTRAFVPPPALATFIVAAACSEDVNIDKEACEHLQSGPAEPVRAADRPEGAPLVKNDHRRYEVELADIGGGRGGFVAFVAPAAARFAFFFGTDVPVRFVDAAGAEVTTETPSRLGRCPEVKSRVAVALGGGAHHLSFGPTSQTMVAVVVEEDRGGR
jgi:hypothetical protein